MRTLGGRFRLRGLPLCPQTAFADQSARDEISAIAPGLWQCNWRGAERLEELAALGIDRVVSVLPRAEAEENPFPDTFRYLNLEVEDTDEDQRGLLPHLARAAAFVGAAAEGGPGRGGCLVHCAAGVSRSSTVVAACLMVGYGMTLREALTAIRERRPIAWPNESLFAELAAFEETTHRGLQSVRLAEYALWTAAADSAELEALGPSPTAQPASSDAASEPGPAESAGAAADPAAANVAEDQPGAGQDYL